MKKDNFLVLGMLAIALALGLAFVGCDNGNVDVPKSIKITGINQANNKANVQVDLNAGDFDIQQGQGEVARGNSDIVNQTVIVDLYTLTSDRHMTENRWIGNGEWCIRLKFRDSATDKARDYVWKEWQKYDIQNAVTELSFADFVLVWTEE